MATITYLVSDLVAQLRTDSDLNVSQVYTDAQLAVVLSDAGAELYDTFTTANQLYNVSQFPFTLVGGIGLNFVLLPLDFQQGHSVDVNPGTQQPYTLRYLPSWLDRNSCSMPYQIFGPNCGPKAYTFLGNELVVLPAVNAAGSYLLYYTPVWTPLGLPTAIPGLVTAVCNTIVASTGTWAFTNAAWNQSHVGLTILVTGSPNPGNNGAHVITAVLDLSNIQTSPTGLVNETTGAGFAMTVQLPNTLYALPQIMNPWVQYIKTQACITVRNKRGMPVDSFEARLQVQKDRIETVLSSRKDEPTQPPMLRGRGGMWGQGDGGWWDA